MIDYGVPITNTMMTDLNIKAEGNQGAITVEVCGVNAEGLIANNIDIDAEDGTIEITVLGPTADAVDGDTSIATPCNSNDTDTADGLNQR